MAGMVPEDVYELTGVADPRLSPDGTTVAYVVGSVDKDANEYRGAIWLAAADGSSPPRRFTTSEKADGDPRWSPDGTLLAFTSNRTDKASQLYVMPVDGGEPRKLTSLKEDVTQAVWSPDGTRIAFVSRVRDAAYEEEDDKKRRPRRLTRLQYKLDSVGWTADRPQALFVVPADGSAEPVQLTAGDCEDHSPSWSPDGLTIAFVSARHPDWDLEMVSDVYLVAAAGGEPRRLTQGGGSGRRPIVVAGRVAARRRAVRRRVRRPQAHQDRAGGRRQWGVHHPHGVTRPELHQLPGHARTALGRRRPRLRRRGPRPHARVPGGGGRLRRAAPGRRRRARRHGAGRGRRPPGVHGQ